MCSIRRMEEDLIIIFDTDCLMCSAWVRFVLRHERAPAARFVSAWSEEGRTLAAEYGFDVRDLDETYLVLTDGRALMKSDATLAILAILEAPWSWTTALRAVPRGLRDWAYDRMARNRYRWFGRADQCFRPPDEHRARFVPGPPRSATLPDHR